MKHAYWLIDPLRLVPSLFGAQALFWWLAMPDQPTIPIALAKYHTIDSVFRYVILLVTLLVSTWLGRWVTTALLPSRRAAPDIPSARRVSAALFIGRLATVLYVIGELVYAREVIANPQILVEAALQGDFIRAGNIAQEGTIGGLTSLANLFLVSTAIFGVLAFHGAVPTATRRTARRWLLFIALLVTTHALVLVARMFVLYFLAVLAGAYLFTAGTRGVRLRLLFSLATAAALLVWTGATLRDAGLFAARENVPILSTEAQEYARDVLVQHYLAADFNNAMVLLDCRPSMTYVGSTVLSSLSPTAGEAYLNCPLISETHGTVNVLAQWWQDLGWLGLAAAALVGAWLGSTFAWARRETHHLGVATAAYLVSFPGVFSMLRINYFFFSIFVFPFLFLVSVWLADWVLRRAPMLEMRPIRRAGLSGSP